jgi:hypothetical protein
MAKARTTKPKDDQTRAAIMAALMAGQGVTEVSKAFQVAKSTVSRIKSLISQSDLEQLGTKKENDFGELLAGYLRETLITLTAQARVFRDENWLKQQPAGELAVLHGVQTDKAIRLLEAVERANEATEEANSDSG